MIEVRRHGLKRMKQQGITPAHQVLDNEISQTYKDEIRESGMSYKLVPPDDHRRNTTERAIQTWKNHFVGVLRGAAITFPLHLWYQSIPQAERQLILLSMSNVNPKISSYDHVYGQHDYNAEPFVPIVMESLVHNKSNLRKTFSVHCRKGYVLGTSFKHYLAWNIWIINTRSTRVSETVFHKHKYLSNPTATPADAIISAAGNLITAIKSHLPHRLQESHFSELTRLSTIFSDAATTPQIDLPQQRRSPSLTTKNTKNNGILTKPHPNLSPPVPMDPPEDIFDHGCPNLNFPETPPRAEPQTNPPRVTPPAPPVLPTPRVEPPNGPASINRSKNPNLRSVSQEAMLRCVTIAQMKLYPKQLPSCRFPIEMINTVLNEETGELTEYRHIMKNCKYCQLYTTSYSKELGRLAQGMRGKAEGTKTIYFIDKAGIPAERWKEVTYSHVVVAYRP